MEPKGGGGGGGGGCVGGGRVVGVGFGWVGRGGWGGGTVPEPIPRPSSPPTLYGPGKRQPSKRGVLKALEEYQFTVSRLALARKKREFGTYNSKGGRALNLTRARDRVSKGGG